MKAKFSFQYMELDDRMVAIPVGDGAQQFHGVLKVNETATAILKLLANDISEEEIVDVLLKEYKGDKEEITKYVRRYIEKLVSEGIVE